MIKKIYIELFIVFVIFCFLTISNISNLCVNHIAPSNFDSQVLLSWIYSAQLGLFPYKDISYPYGIINYYKETILLFSILYYFITPILLSILYLIFKKLFKDKLFTYLSIIFFFFFIYKFTGFDAFNRYGILLSLGLVIGYLFFWRSTVSRKIMFYIGITVGIIFSLFIDQGVYSVIFMLLFLPIHLLICKKTTIIDFVVRLLPSFMYGILLGVVPFTIYLFSSNSVSKFYKNMLDLSDMSLVAKTPFLSVLKTPDNLFSLFILTLCILIVFYKLIILKKYNFSFYIQSVGIIILILLEQKNIIRSMDRIVTLIAAFLLITLFYELRMLLVKLRISKIYIFLYTVVIALSVLFNFNLSPLYPTSENNQVFSKIQMFVSGKCFQENLKTIADNGKYKLVIEKFHLLVGDEKFFSFPSDPILYVINNQIPPYYMTIYESSTKQQQIEKISYIEKNNINYVILNYSIKSTQDNVPDYIRSKYLFQYILNNYYSYAQIDNFLILKKGGNYFNKNILINDDFYNYVTKIDLGSVPRSQGMSIKKEIDKMNIIFTTFKTLSKSLVSRKIYTNRSLLIIKGRISNLSKQKITFVINNDKTTEVYFNPCYQGEYCIIHLDDMPLLYSKKNHITSISSNALLQDISILENFENSRLW